MPPAFRITSSVGAAKFAADAKETMAVLIQLYQSDGHAQEADDPFRSYVLAAWARICSGTKRDREI